MTVTSTGSIAGPSADSSAAPSAADPGPSRRRFWLHSLLLLAVLLAVSALLDNGYPSSSDEGAVLAQVDHLSHGSWLDASSWRIAQPFPALDPTGIYTPLDNSEVADGVYLPYAKHALYPALLLPMWGPLDSRGAIAVSAVAVWAAALAAAAIARRLRPSLAVPTMWLVAIGSPLLFDGSVVMGHALGAALVGWLAVCVLRHLDRSSPIAVAGAMTCAVAVTMLRSEGILVVAALSGVLGLMSIRRSDHRWFVRLDPTRCIPAVLVAASGAAALWIDAAIATRLIDSAFRVPGRMAPSESLVGDRISAFWITVLRPSSGGWGSGGILVFASAVALIAGGVVLRLRPARHTAAAVLFATAAVLAVVAQFAPIALVSGVVPAFPVMVLGLLWLRGRDFRTDITRLCLGTAAISAAAILAVTYSIGGSVEWGGRFFHLLLPLVVPFVVWGLARAWDTFGTFGTGVSATPATLARAGDTTRAPRPSRSTVAASVLIVVASLSLMSLRGMGEMRANAQRVVEAGLAAADAAAPADDGGTPVLVTDFRPFGRSAWRSLDDYRLLRVPPEESDGPLLDDLLDDLLDALSEAGVGTVTLMTGPLQPLPDDIDEQWETVATRRTPGSMTEFVELRRR